MTMAEVQACIDYVYRWELRAETKKQYEAQSQGLEAWLVDRSRGRQDLSWMPAEMGTVIKRHG